MYLKGVYTIVLLHNIELSKMLSIKRNGTCMVYMELILNANQNLNLIKGSINPFPD